MNDLQKRIAFIIEADKMKNILRQNLIADGSRRENDAEHSWHLALCVMTFADYAPAGADQARMLQMGLIHDLVEIYAGDTFAYDPQANIGKLAREQEAARRIFGMLPFEQGAEFRRLWDEFEEMNTPEAMFVAAMDRMQPFLNNYMTGGHTWKLGNVSSPQVYKRLEPLKEAAPALWDYICGLVDECIEKGYIRA